MGNTIPKSMFITDVNTHLDPIAAGGFGRVFKGEYKGLQVALKVVDRGRYNVGVFYRFPPFSGY